MPFSAWLLRRLPSNENGRVTTPTVNAPSLRAIVATTGAPPVPVPPPSPAVITDRRSAIEGSTLPLEEGLRFEAALGLESVTTGIKGAARFAAGEGRGGTGSGV